MSAELHATAWDVYCPDCNEGSGTYDDFHEADAWAEKHNDEYHGDNQ